MKNTLLAFSLLLILIGIASCGNNDVDPKDELYIYGEYTNYNGQSPTFTINSSKTSQYVTYSSAETQEEYTSQGNRVKIKIPNVKIAINNQPYALKGFSVEENKADGWAKQEEFSSINTTTFNKLAAVLVLDMSSSLGSDVNAVKNEAIRFASNFLNAKYGYLGLVLFSETMTTYPFSENSTESNQRIASYTTYKNATTLYGAMDQGIQMLNSFSGTVDRKILITFTDGGDNNTNSPATVRSRITGSTVDRYVIGLRGKGGDYVESDLKSLVSKPENFVAADDVSSVNAAFNAIYKSLPTTSIIQYFRTTQKFTQGSDKPIEIRIKLNTQ